MKYSCVRHTEWLIVGLAVFGPSLTLAQEAAGPRADSPNARLLQVVAETDRRYPGWRIGDLEAKRLQPEARKDSAQVLSATLSQFSQATAGERDALTTAIAAGAEHRLDAAVKRSLASFVERNRAILPALRGLVDCPTGRFNYKLLSNGLATELPHLQPLREQVRLLLADALLRVDDRDDDGALASCRAAVYAARSLYDEPFAISQLVRVACQGQTQMAILAVLSRGRPSESALSATQQIVADEVGQPISSIALLGERAVMFETLGHLAEGSLTLDEITGNTDRSKKFSDEFQEQLVRSGVFRASQGIMLERMNQMVDVIQKPSLTWHEGIERFEQTISSAPKVDPKRNPEEIIPQLLLPSTAPLIRGELRTDALGQALVILIAADRYSMDHGDWPASPEAMVTRYLKSVPTDPLNGKPMRLIREGDRIIAYSLGVNGRDDGGKVAGSSRQGVEKSPDIGFELSIGRAR